MKRISTTSLSTALQLPFQTISPANKSLYPLENNIHPQETQLSNNLITEKSAHLHFPRSLFAQCFPSAFEPFRSNKTYRKLQHHSLDKRKIQKLPNTNQDYQQKKTVSLKNSFLSFGKQILSNQNSRPALTEPKNKCLMTGNQNNSKCNVQYGSENTGRSSLMVSTRNTANERLSKYQNSLNTKLFLSEDFKISHILSPFQTINNTQIEQIYSQTKKVSDQKQTIAKRRRLSTNDSIKLKDNSETDQSQPTNSPLETASILCQSIPVNLQRTLRINPSDFDQSFIEKLNIFRKQESFIESKKKSFIRSNKKILQESPRFGSFEPNFWDQKQQNNNENEQELTNLQKIDSKLSVEEKMIRNKFKTLKECGKTIVSNYNKSSEQKSILQESNIVFQASKMCVEPYDQNLKIPTFSDSQVIFNNELKQKFDNDKPYNSFIDEVDSSKNSDIRLINPNSTNMSKKVNRAFLRSKKSRSQKQIRCKNDDEMEIRFDLDIFIEYGPL